MDAHLMVKHPQDYIEACAAAGAAYITPHTDCIESDAFVTINKIISLGCKAGIAMNPAAPLEDSILPSPSVESNDYDRRCRICRTEGDHTDV